jgi:hypothetical protein
MATCSPQRLLFIGGLVTSLIDIYVRFSGGTDPMLNGSDFGVTYGVGALSRNARRHSSIAAALTQNAPNIFNFNRHIPASPERASNLPQT